MKALFIPLKTAYFELFATGLKNTEYRVYGPRWNENTCYEGRSVVLSHGYGKHRRLRGRIVRFHKSLEPTRTAAWQDCYGTTDQIAACIEIQIENERGGTQ